MFFFFLLSGKKKIGVVCSLNVWFNSSVKPCGPFKKLFYQMPLATFFISSMFVDIYKFLFLVQIALDKVFLRVYLSYKKFSNLLAYTCSLYPFLCFVSICSYSHILFLHFFLPFIHDQSCSKIWITCKYFFKKQLGFSFMRFYYIVFVLY